MARIPHMVVRTVIGRTAWVLLGLWLAAAGLAHPALAAQASPRSPEYLIKAAYLYNFAMFVDWPPDGFAAPDAPLVIGVVGGDPFGWALDKTIADRRISKRRIVVERLQWTQDLRHCHILFVSSAGYPRAAEVLQRLQSLPILVVDDDAGRGTRDWTIGFAVRDNKVGFLINLDNARRGRLSISSKMLGLAQEVQ